MKRGRGSIPVEPLRRAFDRSGMTAAEVARELEWTRRVRGRQALDGLRVRRALGIRPTPAGAGMSRYREHVDEATAVKLARAIGVAPVEVGL